MTPTKRLMSLPGAATATLLTIVLAVASLAAQAPANANSATEPGSSASADPCTLSKLLVPSCGRLWGAAPAAFSDLDPVRASERFEKQMKSGMDVFHGYHRDAQLFPTKDEIRAATGSGADRLLLLNYKPSTTHTWREIANGAVDSRLRRLADHITANFDRPFFFTTWHEPENDVDQTDGSGMTAADFRAMFRHVQKQLVSHGADQLVFVMNYQGYPRYAAKKWYKDLWPGRHYVDWVASDSYNTGRASGWNTGDFRSMVNRKTGGNSGWPGFYSYFSHKFPNKPLMLAEWGVFSGTSGRQAWFYDKMRKQLSDYPRLKALVYFNSDRTPRGEGTSIDATAGGRAAYRDLTNSIRRVPIG